METQLLKDPDVYPSNEVLEKILGKSYLAFKELVEKITESEYGLTLVWNYYKDGNAWLCKVVFKKKTIFWLSVWDAFFKITFYFTEKTAAGISELDIPSEVKEVINQSKPIGRLLPMTLTIYKKEQVLNILKIAGYKKKLK